MTSETMEIIYQLKGYPAETEWLEFKRNKKDALAIGEDISALANAAAYHERPFAYKIWGVENESRALVGTAFKPLQAKAKGNQDLLIWLRQQLTPNANYEFIELQDGDLDFVVLKIAAAKNQPVRFQSTAYIREGSSTTQLRPGSEKEAELWRKLQQADFEQGIACQGLTFEEMEDLLDLNAYFRLVEIQRPSQAEYVLDALTRQGLLARQDDGLLSITNLGAILIAKSLSAFPPLRKRRLRVVRFLGNGKTDIIEDVFFERGYALTLSEAQDHILASSNQQDVQEGAFRRIRSTFPERAVRELLSNVVIHQDLNDNTQSPEVHIFNNRIEFTNPGAMLVPRDRVVNAQPKTRNAALVNILRQMDLCEEEGTGWDRVIEDCEARHIMAPTITSEEGSGTQVILYAGSPYQKMSKRERMEAAYWHACLMVTQFSALTNTSLRERFGLSSEQKNVVSVSRLIRECCNAGLLREEDPEAGNRNMRYVPFWA